MLRGYLRSFHLIRVSVHIRWKPTVGRVTTSPYGCRSFTSTRSTSATGFMALETSKPTFFQILGTRSGNLLSYTLQIACLCPRPWFLYRIMRTRETNPTIREQIDPRSVSTDSRSLWLTSACFGQKGPRAELSNTCALVNPTTSGNYKQWKVFWAFIERKLACPFYFLSKLSLFCDFDFILLCL